MENDKHYVNMLSNMIFHNFQSQSNTYGYNTTKEKNDALNDLMSANTDDGDETRFYEIQDQSMSFKNAIITMIVFGLIVNTFLLIERIQTNEKTSKRGLVLNIFYSGVYLPLAYWMSENHGSDILCGMKNSLSILLMTLTHIIVLDHLGVKFVETLKSLSNSEPANMSITLIQQPEQESKSAETLPTRKWKILYLIALILSLPEMFIWKWSKRKDKCYLSVSPAKSKHYVAYLLFIKYLLPFTIAISLGFALLIKYATRLDKSVTTFYGSPCQKWILTTCYVITFLPIYIMILVNLKLLLANADLPSEITSPIFLLMHSFYSIQSILYWLIPYVSNKIKYCCCLKNSL